MISKKLLTEYMIGDVWTQSISGFNDRRLSTVIYLHSFYNFDNLSFTLRGPTIDKDRFIVINEFACDRKQ